MATYAIGDIQGCYTEFKNLLQKIRFNRHSDQLWLAGDLINRGPGSLETLLFIYEELQDRSKIILGNHDLHLIACAYGARQPSKGDTIQPILDHPQCNQLITWLKHQPLLIDDPELQCCMAHAGIPHIWSLEKATQLAKEASDAIIQQPPAKFDQFFSNSFNHWSDALSQPERTCCIVNYFTRMRLINPAGTLELTNKGPVPATPSSHQSPYQPWFSFYPTTASTKEHPIAPPLNRRLVFGHWAALNGQTDHPFIFALDTGCVWGGTLSALRLDDLTHFQTPALQ